jgi:tetratricopeptide (TPR) repeat protein
MKNFNIRNSLSIYILIVFLGVAFSTIINNPCQAQTQSNAASYAPVIQQADKALADKDYASALQLYEKARQIKPELKYASGKIAEITEMLDAQPDKKSQLFEDIIIKAENHFNQKEYPLAKTEYQKALGIDPSAQFPKDRLAQISTLFVDPTDAAYFSEAISNGDKALAANEFDKSVLFYETALAVKPNTKSVKDKITNARKLQSDYKLKGEQVVKLLAGAYKLLTAGKRTEALVEYQKVLVIFPENQHAKDKIQEIEKFANDKKSLQDTYDKVIELADQFYVNRDFVNARLKYQEALKVKPEARYPKEMLDKTKSGESQLLSEQEKYDAALSSAENLLKSNDYDAALIGFKSASAIKPTETYPKTKITDIEKLVGERNSRKEAFDIAIKNGDQAFEGKKYDAALTHFKNALSLLPNEKYPSDKIGEITALMAQQKALDDTYKKSIADGDLLFKQNKFAESIIEYTKAQEIKPEETYPQQKITDAQNQLTALRSKDENYTSAIETADKSFAEKKYEDALAAYDQALKIKPTEKYPKDKTEEINKILAKEKADANTYAQSISNGDKAFAAGNYSIALTSFQDALKIKPTEKYPQDKITETQAAIDEQQKSNEKYSTAIASADKSFAAKEYDQALVSYTEASGIKKNEKYPQDQIAKINKLLGEMRSADESYTQAITEGDNNFQDLKYAEAIASYTRANTYKSGESYPKAQIEKITGLIAEQKKLEADYQTSIGSADKYFAAKKYDEAITDYRKALVLKPSEKYPSDKIVESEKLIADLKTLEDSFNKALAEGDKLLSDKDFTNSMVAFKSANQLKPSEAYPKQKITEIQAILDKDKAEGQRYDEAIAQADKLFDALKYKESLEPYQRAAGIKSNEKYPQEQIVKVNQLLAEQQKLDEEYLKAITDAELEFKNAKYNEAKVLYSNASTLKPTENLPKAKIVEIDAILADLQNKEQSFAGHIRVGNAKFAENKYDEAILSFKNALKIKPAEAYPKTQIEKITQLIAEQKKLDADYQVAIVSADKFLASKKYDEAIVDYRKALVLKPSEKYPADKIVESEQLIADLKALEDSYNKAVADGDKLLSDKDFSNSLIAFKNASQLKPGETYPKQKIAEVQAIFDKDKAEGQRYSEAIAQADKLFDELKYKESLEPYQRASGIKPTEKYPQEQIAKVNQLLAEQKKLDEEYLKAITDAELEFKIAKFNEAKVLYSNASTIKPTENLPKAKIVEIDAILADLLQKDQDYSKAIGDGDGFFAEKKYTEAATSYSTASLIKPAETYPKTQISKIENLIKEQKILDDNYLNIITSADQLFEAQKFADAITEYRKALALKPSEKYPVEKIAEAEKEIASIKEKQLAYDKDVADGDKKLLAKEYENALTAFKNANLAKPSEEYPTTKITELEAVIAKQKTDNFNYADAIALADNFFKDQKYREAMEPYQRATTIKPSEKYPQDQIIAINKFLADQKKIDDDYQKLLTDADTQLKAAKYNEAKAIFVTASTLKPIEKLPKDKIAEIEGILSEIKSKDENYTKALNSAAEFYAAKNPEAAIKTYEEASLLKPGEKYPQERISAIKAELKVSDDNYKNAIALGDSKLASKNLMEALNAYQNALEIKPSENFPKTKIAEINTMLLAQKEEMEKMYASYIADGDALFNSKDYFGAKSAYTKAAGIKPDESYPKQRLTETNKIVEEIELTRKAEYAKALGEADKLYNTKIFDQAIDAYEAASKINPSDSYPENQINKIRKYISDHAIQDLYSQAFQITEGNEKKFTFSSIEPRLRKNNYILLKARSTGKSSPKVYLNYGKDSQKNGGIVLRSLDKTVISDYMIRISVQDKWYREDNNWISIYVETGDVEITKVQIAAGDE